MAETAWGYENSRKVKQRVPHHCQPRKLPAGPPAACAPSGLVRKPRLGGTVCVGRRELSGPSRSRKRTEPPGAGIFPFRRDVSWTTPRHVSLQTRRY